MRTPICSPFALPIAALLLAAGCATGSTFGSNASTTGDDTTATTTATSASSTTGGASCDADTDCPDPGGDCTVATCEAGGCALDIVEEGTPIGGQSPGDCKVVQCDGAGGVTTATDDTDIATSDPCAVWSCAAGVPSSTPAASGTSCGQDLLCDGEGQCVGCLVATDCPGADTECQQRTCTAGTCGVTDTPAGTKLSTQTSGDCHVDTCDGAGGTTSAVDDTDLPDDANACTDDVCAGGVASNPSAAAGTLCSAGVGKVCDGAGTCVQCLQPADCPAPPNACVIATCSATVCGTSNVANGTIVAGQVVGDCQIAKCSGVGTVTATVDDNDLPVDGSVCTTDVCTSGTASNPPLPTGTSCTQNAGTRCSAAGQCVPTVRVVRVGDGSAPLSVASAAVFVEERMYDGALIGASATLAMPVAAVGANQPLTVTGTAGSEANLSRSEDGKYVLLAGYGAAPGYAAVAATSALVVNRVVARIDAAGNVDTSTRLDVGMSGSNARSATSSNGFDIWVSGNGVNSLGGVWYVPFGSTGGTQLVNNPGNARFTHVVDGQLYGAASSGAFLSVFSVGVGLPITAGQAATTLPGLPASGTTSPYSFVLLDRDPNVPGVDALYLADDRGPAAGGGVQRWTFDGATWTQLANLSTGVMTGFRGLAGRVSGADATIIGTTSEASLNRLVLITDDGSMSPPAQVIATAGVNTLFRGVALSPD